MIESLTTTKFTVRVVLPKGAHLKTVLRGTDPAGGDIYELEIVATSYSEELAFQHLREARDTVARNVA